MADFERDIELLEEYSQWRAVNKGKGDSSPTAFMVQKAQEEAFDKLERLERWADENHREIGATALAEFKSILEGRV